MPLKLTAHTLDRTSPHRPLRDQLADHIRQAIATGELMPGEKLPGEVHIADAVGVDRSTVRFAISILINEGRILRSQGKPAIVAPAVPVRRMDTSRYTEEMTRLRAGERAERAEEDAFTIDHNAAWEDYTVDPILYTESLATEIYAQRLAVPVEELLIHRFMVKRLQGEAVQVLRSTVPYEFGFGTILADPSVQPYPGGTLAELYDVGLIPDDARVTATEDVQGYAPNAEERRLLEMTGAGHVWNIVRVLSVNGRPIEVSEILVPQARNVLRYETDLS